MNFTLPDYPYGHPKNEDYAYDKWRQEQLDREIDRSKEAEREAPKH